MARTLPCSDRGCGLLQEFFDVVLANKTRMQIAEDLAVLAADVGASKETVLGLMSLALENGPNCASNIATVRAVIRPSPVCCQCCVKQLLKLPVSWNQADIQGESMQLGLSAGLWCRHIVVSKVTYAH